MEPSQTILRIYRYMRRTLITLGLLYLILSIAAGYFLCTGTLHPARRPLTLKDRSEAQSLALREHASFDDVAITTPDHLQLRAWLLVPTESNRQGVILLHGLSDNRTGMLGYAELLLTHHFTLLLPDARAHGASDGPLATYGLLERNDIHLWFDWLLANQHPACIDGLGESMGAAQLLQSLSVEPRFCAVAAESAFSSFREIGYDRAGQFFHTGPWLGRTLLRPALTFAFWFGKKGYGLDLTQVSPEGVVAHTRVPVLLIHGRDDSNIPVRHSHILAATNSQISLWEVPNADHCGAISTAPGEFSARVLAWFARFSSPDSASKSAI